MPQLALTLSGQLVDLPADAEVALSYRANDVRTLESREAAFSETFTLPNTARNRRVLGNPHDVASLTSSPYQLLPAVLTSPGGVVVLQGFAALEASGEGFDVTLSDALGGLFALVGDRSLQELDLRAYDHPLTYASTLGAEANDYTEGYTYPLADLGTLDRRPAGIGLLPEELPAATYVHALLTAMLAAPLPPAPLPLGYQPPLTPLAGWRLTGSLLQEERYQNLVLPRATAWPQLRESYLYPYRVKAYVAADRTYANIQTSVQFADVRAGELFAGQLYSPPPHAIGLKFSLRLPIVQASSNVQFTLCQQDGSGPVQELYFATAQTATGAQVLAFDQVYPVVQATATTRFFVRINAAGPVTLKAGASFTVEPLPRALPGAPVHLEASLPSLSQAELLKLVFNQFNVIVQADPFTKRLRLDLGNDVERNRNRAVDWTSKIDWHQRPRLSYALDNYAQANVLDYAPAPDLYAEQLALTPAPYDDEPRGRGVLRVVNQRLEPVRAALSSPLLLPLPHATLVSLGATYNAELAWLPFFQQTDLTLTAYPWDDQHEYVRGAYCLYQGQSWKCIVGDGQHTTVGLPPPSGDNRFYKIGDQQWEVAPDVAPMASDRLGSIALLTPYGGGTQVHQPGHNGPAYTPARQLSREGLRFSELLTDFYAGLTAMLARFQLLTLSLRLTAFDIAQLDFTLPVRLTVPHANGYGQLDILAYLNEIQQYQPALSGAPVPCVFSVLGLPVPGLAPKVPMPLPGSGSAFITEDAAAFLLTEDGYYILLD